MNAMDNSAKVKNDKAHSVASYIILCFFAASEVCFFVPMDIYIANLDDIAFPMKPLAIFMAIVTLAVFAGLFLVCMLTSGKANKIVRAVIFGVSTAFYIQGNYLAVNMGLLDGSRYEPSAWKSALNIVIWLAITAIPFFILIKFPKIFENVASYVPAAIILIHALALVLSIGLSSFDLDVALEAFEGDTRWICTAADLNVYSENKNLIIILADEYDSFAFDDAVKAEPDAVSEFDGFTYYTNTVGKFDFTDPSLACILTNDKTGNARYDDLTFLETVSKNYKANFYCETIAPPPSVFSKFSDNIYLKKISLGDTRGYAGEIYKIALFRCMPEVLKPLFFSSGNIEQNIRSKTTSGIDLTDGVPIYSFDDLDLYNSMPRELEPTEDDVFKFIYLFGLHAPRTVTGTLERTPGKGESSPEDCAVAVNKIVNEYLKILKNNGMYDNSEIIFMADHGHYNGKKYPLLMYKPAHQTETGIKISNAPISYDDMFPTLVMLAGGKPNGRTIFDIGENEERVRYFGTTDEEIARNIKENPQ